MAIEIHTPPTEWLSAALDQVIQVYRVAFTVPPWNETEENVAAFGERLAEHAQRAGFRCVTALNTDADRIVGFAYGYTGTAGELWFDMVSRALEPAKARHWLSDCFEFVELALVPAVRGRGIGGRLHDALLAGLPHRTAVLSTVQQDTPAMHLYRSRGWVSLYPDLHFHDCGRPYAVLGLELQPAITGMRQPE